MKDRSQRIGFVRSNFTWTGRATVPMARLRPPPLRKCRQRPPRADPIRSAMPTGRGCPPRRGRCKQRILDLHLRRRTHPAGGSGRADRERVARDLVVRSIPVASRAARDPSVVGESRRHVHLVQRVGRSRRGVVQHYEVPRGLRDRRTVGRRSFFHARTVFRSGGSGTPGLGGRASGQDTPRAESENP
jgi:hypothetical protein